MKCIEKLAKDIYSSSKIPFQLIIDEVLEYTSLEFDITQDFKEKEFNYKDTKCCIKVNAAFGIAIDLLEFCVKEKLNEVFIQKKSIISLLLNGEDIEKDKIRVAWPEISEKFTLISIYVQNKIEEALFFVEECYYGSDIEVALYKGNILLIGNFEDIWEHLSSIRETITNNILGKCYIGYSEANNYMDFKKSYEALIYKLKLAIKYNISQEIFDDKKLILEGIVDSVSEEMKDEIYNDFSERISKLDNEMIKTIDVFLKCGLNLSDAAKELYIHRKYFDI